MKVPDEALEVDSSPGRTTWVISRVSSITGYADFIRLRSIQTCQSSRAKLVHNEIQIYLIALVRSQYCSMFQIIKHVLVTEFTSVLTNCFSSVPVLSDDDRGKNSIRQKNR